MDDFLSGWNLLLLALALVFAVGAFAVWQANIDTPIYTVQFVSPFHYNAKGDDRMNLNDEYVTLKNTGEDAIDMTGWSLKTSETMSSPSQVVLTFLMAQQSRYIPAVA